MNFKSLLFTDAENTDKPVPSVPVTPTVKFPTQTETPSTFSSHIDAPVFTNQSSGSYSQDHLAKALDTYQGGFDSLKQAGFGFYELYHAIISGDMNNPMTYTMAFTMGYGMDKTLTKDKLTQQADYYVSKIQEVYSDFVNKGQAKKQDLLNQKNNEKQSLAQDVDSINQQIEALKIQLNDRQNKLSAIEGKYTPMINELDSKLAANDAAKTQVVSSIKQVQSGIVNNIK